MITLTTLSYIDPATTTALLSSLSSIGVAVGATFLILWRKFKKSIVKMLHMDENSGKIVEDELIIYDETILEAANEQLAKVAATEVKPEQADKTVQEGESEQE